jgi:ketosteroid isomerase-like protein
MRVAVLSLVILFIANQLAFGLELTEEQKGPWNTLEKQVALDMKKDLEGEMEYMHPKACFWGFVSPVPVPASAKAYSYYEKWIEGQDDVIAHNMIPVSVIVVDDVAIINFYLHILTKDDEGKQKELIIRGHNTWKKEKDRWLLLATYNTKVKSEEEADD